MHDPEQQMSPERFGQMLTISLAPGATEGGVLSNFVEQKDVYIILTSGLHMYYSDLSHEQMEKAIAGLGPKGSYVEMTWGNKTKLNFKPTVFSKVTGISYDKNGDGSELYPYVEQVANKLVYSR